MNVVQQFAEDEESEVSDGWEVSDLVEFIHPF